MLLDGRKQHRTPERFLLQISAVQRPSLVDIGSVENLSPCGARVSTHHFWGPGSHVDIKSRARELSGRARVVYCHPADANTFAVGLNFLTTNGLDTRSETGRSRQLN